MITLRGCWTPQNAPGIMCGAPKSVGAVFGRTLDLETPGIQAVVSPADRRNGIANTHRTQIVVIRPRTAEPGGSQSARIPPNLEGRGSPNLQGKRQRRPCSTLIQKKTCRDICPPPLPEQFFRPNTRLRKSPSRTSAPHT